MEKQQKPKESFTMQKVPSSERPRERVQRLGAESVSDMELLEIVISRGIKDEPVRKIVQGLMHRFVNLQGVAGATIEELSTIKGIGPAKACQIKAAFELANRWDRSLKKNDRVVISTPEEAYNELKGKSRGKQKEHFWAIMLDTRNHLIKTAEISVGSLDTSIVHPRELFKEAMAASASSVIVAHNHPSGNPEPSQDDIKLSRRLKEAGELVGIAVVDHLIIGDGRYLSLKREGLL